MEAATIVKGVVLAAGEGTRLRAVSGERPKVLLEVGGKPLLTHVLRLLARFGPEGYAIVVGRGAEAVVDRYGDRFEGRPIEYVRQRPRKGLAHALTTAEPVVTGPFLAVHGDAYFPDPTADALPRVVASLREREAAASILVEDVPAARATAGVCIADRAGIVRRVVERPRVGDRRAGLVVAGFYAFAPSIFRACRAIVPSARGEYELADALTWLVERGERVVATRLDGVRVNVNRPVDLARARRLAREAGSGDAPRFSPDEGALD